MIKPEYQTIYLKLANPPASLYTALCKQVEISKTPKGSLPPELYHEKTGRVFAMKEGGYMALSIYYYYLKHLGYSQAQCMDEAGMTKTMIERTETSLINMIKGDPLSRFQTKIRLIRNYMLLEQLKIPYELIMNDD